jgi:hypothetical protein
VTSIDGRASFKDQKPFTRYNEDKAADTFTVKFNAEERLDFNRWKKLIRQPKDSTAIKQLATIGAKVILRQETSEVLEVLFNNERKNKRTGIVEWE